VAKRQDVWFGFDAATGRTVWTHSYDCPQYNILHEGGPAATPTVDAGRVFILSRHGHLRCLSADTGKKVWSHDLFDEFKAAPAKGHAGHTGSPLVLGDLLIVNVGGPNGASTVAFKKADGTMVWKVGNESFNFASPVTFQKDGKAMLAVMKVRGIEIIDPSAGKILASYPWKAQYDIIAATPVVSGDRLFISTGYGRGGTVVRFTGDRVEKVWENREMQNQYTNCVLVDGYLYGMSDNAQLRCLSFDDGTVKWSKDGLKAGGLLASDGRLIIQTESGEVVVAAASPAGYKELARAKVLNGGKAWTMPTLANSRLYCRNDKGMVACLDLKGK